ncbi:Hypothetical predicted protein [Podarcis lilfordi]|uniref:Uncharacterized protein n=1 Tax=Podarcis lilfordi TaxID=74358 RepID=A0AA35JW65_9SAUR|nr:Hypothetical predicted protein [Podarcis lilfordi]
MGKKWMNLSVPAENSQFVTSGAARSRRKRGFDREGNPGLFWRIRGCFRARRPPEKLLEGVQKVWFPFRPESDQPGRQVASKEVKRAAVLFSGSREAIADLLIAKPRACRESATFSKLRTPASN